MGSMACSRALVIASLVTLSACRFGRAPEDIMPATTPTGASVQVTYRQSGIEVTDMGESIEVRDDGIVVRLSDGFTLIRFGALVEARFQAAGGPRRIRQPGGRGTLDELVQVSRYPFGISDEQLSRLLASANQPELIEVGP
jgi:hypothetical protein